MYDHIISKENLLLAWKDFTRGKKNKFDGSVRYFKLVEVVPQ